MKKSFPILFCLLFFLCCALLSVGAFVGSADSGAEGRELAAFPSLTREDGSLNTAFPAQFDLWLTDHFSGRRTLITANAWIREHIFRTGSDQVTVGRDGFLFYRETAADFTGESAMSEEELAAAADALARLSAYAAERGAQLIVAIAPNKNSVYPEMMPAVWQRGQGESNMTRLQRALSERGVAYADLLTALTEEKESGLLYHKRDTHWNGAGAIVACRTILETAGAAQDVLTDVTLTPIGDFAGDLDGMLYPSLTLTDDNFVPGEELTSRFIYTSVYKTPMDMTITTRGRGEGRALVFRDSFGSAVIPFLSAVFGEVRYERATPYRIDLLEQFEADTVIVEIAERNIPLLTSAADRLMGDK